MSQNIQIECVICKSSVSFPEDYYSGKMDYVRWSSMCKSWANCEYPDDDSDDTNCGESVCTICAIKK